MFVDSSRTHLRAFCQFVISQIGLEGDILVTNCGVDKQDQAETKKLAKHLISIPRRVRSRPRDSSSDSDAGAEINSCSISSLARSYCLLWCPFESVVSVFGKRPTIMEGFW